jgi:hypothetical protein
MARLFIEGFEANSVDGWGGNFIIASASGKNLSGNYCVVSNGTNTSLYKYLESSYSALYIAFKFHPTNVGNDAVFGWFDSGGTSIASLRRNSNQTFSLTLGQWSGTVLATGTTLYSANTSYLIEMYYYPKNSGGTFTLKVDGVEDCTYTGDTTNGLENVKGIRLGYMGGSNAGINAYYDDVVVDDANWIGNTKIQGQFVSGAGSNTGLTASAGNNYACVDEIPYSDTDYVYGDTNDLIDTYATSDLTESVTTIKCIQVSIRAAYAGTPTPTKIEAVIRPGSTDHSHATQISPGINFTRHDRIWEVNPDDSAAFEAADLDAMEIGVKLVA